MHGIVCNMHPDTDGAIGLSTDARTYTHSRTTRKNRMKLPKQGQLLAMIDLEDCEQDEIPTTLPNGMEHSNLHMLCLICRKGSQELPPSIDPALYDKIPEDFHEYLLIFDKSTANCLPVKRIWDHEIKMKEGFLPKSAKVYPLSPSDREAVNEWLDEHLAKGYIQESKSPQTSPIFFVPKKDGRKRMVQDYRYLNAWTVRNAYPLPLISDLIDRLNGAQFFTKLDLRSGHFQIRMDPLDVHKTAFRTHHRHFEFLVMPFSLSNAPSTFQSLMNKVFKAHLRKFILVFFDDILIYSSTWVEHLKHVRIAFSIL